MSLSVRSTSQRAYALEELTSLPRIVGAGDDLHRRSGRTAVRTAGGGPIPTITKEAELAKLFTNTWRYTKFAVASQLFTIANAAGVGDNHVLAAIRRDYPKAPDLPGSGFAAGPCLVKGTMRLAGSISGHFPLGQSAMQINEGMPACIVSAMERRYGALGGRTIGLLWMAFKAESDDPRASLSFKLRKLLDWAGATVLCTDPDLPDDRMVPIDQVLREGDIIVLGAPTSACRSLRIGACDVVDVWGALGGIRL